ncbi:tetratricopeptide repeat protein [Paramagnetospirillum magneticum]|uniref:TPR repeat n=1 Tax=Paramagnetospirillum magneticum (strain ATCC 700264 / AMB-1) TaxID=342108 RepID=Q2W5D5_PARM1|nr:tetratricopeptide repeat protein [Paramagnetospirillum magneticum]BAE50940.1 TPR repeat [Paramagnetospirillum magneticum AMB-1]
MNNAVLLQSMFQRAVQAFNGGNLEMAAAECERMLGIDRRNTAAMHILGSVAFRRGDPAGAADLLAKVVKQDPGRIQAVITLGEAQLALSRFSDAAANFRKVAAARPDDPVPHYNLGLALRGLGRLDEAAAVLERCRDMDPSVPAPWNVLGDIRRAQGRLDEAVTCLERAIQLDPGHSMAYNNLGVALQAQDRTEEAISVLERGLALQPDDPELHYSLGCSLQEATRTADATASYRRAIALRPDYGAAHWNLSHSLLRGGDFSEGWAEYDWRWQTVQTADRHPQPLWTGDPADGRTILLWEEQGLGDTLQFIRFAPQLAAAGWKVVAVVQKPLKLLLSNLAGVEVLARGEALPPFDVHCPLMGLPGRLGSTPETIPSRPYLAAEPGKVAAWRERLVSQGLRVGVVWRGNPDNKRNPYRSMPSPLLAGLLNRPDVQLVNLQKDAQRDELDAMGAGARLFDATSDLTDFSDTAALVASLDLVVTVCTSVCHLAGGLGVPTWVLLDARADWRWFEGRLDSPWYPSARLFRQPSPGDWASVMAQVSEALPGFK